MIAFAQAYVDEQPSAPAWHDGIMAVLPQIYHHLRFAFRRMPPDDRAEAMADCIASIALTYARMYQRGKADVAYARTLVDFAVRHFYAGRRTGCELNSNDISSPDCQRQRGLRLESLDRRMPNGEWKEVVVEDGRATPAEVAASRIDIQDWIHGLPRLKRGIAETLATGETTTQTANRFSVTPGRISQLRRELADSWEVFQSQALALA